MSTLIELKPGDQLTAEWIAEQCITNLDVTTPGLQERARGFGANPGPRLVEQHMVVQIMPFALYLLCEAVLAGRDKHALQKDMNHLLPHEMTPAHLALKCSTNVTLLNSKLVRRAKKMRKRPESIREHTVVQMKLADLRRICEAVLDAKRLQRDTSAEPEPTIMQPHESVADPAYEPPIESTELLEKEGEGSVKGEV